MGFQNLTHRLEQQADQGLIGTFVILPEEDNIMNTEIPYKDYILLLQQWEISQPTLQKVKNFLRELSYGRKK